MATLADCRVLLLDEHTAALDPRMAGFVLDLTRRLWKECRLTALMVTHSMDERVVVRRSHFDARRRQNRFGLARPGAFAHDGGRIARSFRARARRMTRSLLESESPERWQSGRLRRT